MSGQILIIFFHFAVIPVLHAKRVDSDQTPRIAASDPGLRCLLKFFFGTLGIDGLSF